MILGFKECFKQKILNGEKIHTIREDKGNRWGDGKSNRERLIHMATGVRTPDYTCFKEARLVSTEPFSLYRQDGRGLVIRVWAGGITLWSADFMKLPKTAKSMNMKLERLAKNDGFDRVKDFFDFFPATFHGKIIHWTDFSYWPP